jgi:hypothetical protein
MGKEFQCPKCGSDDTYMAAKHVSRGTRWTMDVMRPFCRTCDIEALSLSTIQRANNPKAKMEPGETVLVVGLVAIGIALSYTQSIELSYAGFGLTAIGAVLGAYFLFKKRK